MLIHFGPSIMAIALMSPTSCQTWSGQEFACPATLISLSSRTSCVNQAWWCLTGQVGNLLALITPQCPVTCTNTCTWTQCTLPRRYARVGAHARAHTHKHALAGLHGNKGIHALNIFLNKCSAHAHVCTTHAHARMRMHATRTHTCMRTEMCEHMHMHSPLHTRTHLWKYNQVHVCLRMSAHTDPCACVYDHLHTGTCTQVHMHGHANAHKLHLSTCMCHPNEFMVCLFIAGPVASPRLPHHHLCASFVGISILTENLQRSILAFVSAQRQLSSLWKSPSSHGAHSGRTASSSSGGNWHCYYACA